MFTHLIEPQSIHPLNVQCRIVIRITILNITKLPFFLFYRTFFPCFFFPFATSDYYSTRMMGTLLPFCLIVALLADVLLVPAMAKVGWIAFPAPEGNVTRSNPRVAD